ncbi:hypothetical protein DET57_110218 [Klebsiella oxytoca]|uniref:Uncharacterized protein n=1 Tax=Klebsiella oxytoca TaxID=571 RepID=A0A318FXE1_KLEOX|nr:hypothetical protein [Klebsiella oxytoca]PXW44103.1 hypothetical protein DET57_110218 [Klebsiella oxytoca]HCB1501781.1 hypothetical protein [Klebsiella michiganensis]HCB1848080.1 hypothetical protein [Klebsiella oxytoca]
MSENIVSGGWSINSVLLADSAQIPQEYLDIFNEAVGELEGVGYSPLLYCGEQVVSGHNYMFIARKTLVHPSSQHHIVKMVIYKPLSGKATFDPKYDEVLI